MISSVLSAGAERSGQQDHALPEEARRRDRDRADEERADQQEDREEDDEEEKPPPAPDRPVLAGEDRPPAPPVHEKDSGG